MIIKLRLSSLLDPIITKEIGTENGLRSYNVTDLCLYVCTVSVILIVRLLYSVEGLGDDWYWQTN